MSSTTAPRTLTRPADPPAGVRSLWRLKGYLRPHVPALAVMLVTALLGVGVSLAIPLVTKEMIDGPIANRDIGPVLPLGLLALALGVVEALLIFWRRWVQSTAVLGLETEIRGDLSGDQPVLRHLPVRVGGAREALRGARGGAGVPAGWWVRRAPGRPPSPKLLARFYDPTAGRVLLDGVDLRDLDEPTLRRAVVMVTQEDYMFGGTVGRQHPVRPARCHDRGGRGRGEGEFSDLHDAWLASLA